MKLMFYQLNYPGVWFKSKTDASQFKSKTDKSLFKPKSAKFI
jgi:hypothetical protein